MGDATAGVGPVSLLCIRTTLRHGFALRAGVGAGSIRWFAVLTTGVALAGRRLGDRAVQAADLVAGSGLVGFGALLGVRTLRDG